jgi:hypothetical protein
MRTSTHPPLPPPPHGCGPGFFLTREGSSPCGAEPTRLRFHSVDPWHRRMAVPCRASLPWPQPSTPQQRRGISPRPRGLYRHEAVQQRTWHCRPSHTLSSPVGSRHPKLTTPATGDGRPRVARRMWMPVDRERGFSHPQPLPTVEIASLDRSDEKPAELQRTFGQVP